MLQHFTEAQLYTDGSAFKEGSAAYFLKGKETTITTGAIVGTDVGDSYTATRVDFATTKLIPYLTEHVTTMYARKRFTADIASDCQGSIRKLHRARMGRRSFDTYYISRDGYQAKAFKPLKWADSTGDFAGKMYRTYQPQSVNERSTCSKIIYDQQLHDRDLAKVGASPIGCVYKFCSVEDLQHISSLVHTHMLACRT